jgi:hypothetical protein
MFLGAHKRTKTSLLARHDMVAALYPHNRVLEFAGEKNDERREQIAM